MLNPGRRKVVLFLPPYAGKLLGPPLGLLSLASSLREAGIEPCIIDGALHRDYLRIIRQEVHDALVSEFLLLTGPMIRDAIQASRNGARPAPGASDHLRRMASEPAARAQTLREAFVDMVVRHQGENTLVEILRRLEAGKSLDMVAGCWFKRNGQIHSNPDRPATPLMALPTPAYDLVDLRRL